MEQLSVYWQAEHIEKVVVDVAIVVAAAVSLDTLQQYDQKLRFLFVAGVGMLKNR